jgi:hypothetical protein
MAGYKVPILSAISAPVAEQIVQFDGTNWIPTSGIPSRILVLESEMSAQQAGGGWANGPSLASCHSATSGLLTSVDSQLLLIESEVSAVQADKSGYVNRGDPAANDFEVGDFTCDAAEHDLDLSGIIPVGCKAIQFFIAVKDDAAGSVLSFFPYVHTYNYNRCAIRTQVADVDIYADYWLVVDSNRKIKYKATNTVWTMISFCIKGWLI